MRRIEWVEQYRARAPVAVVLSRTVVLGSELHLSGKRFAAQWTTTFGLFQVH